MSVELAKRHDSESLSLSRMRAILDGLADAAVIVDQDLRPIAWNQAYINSVGLRGRRFLKTIDEPGKRCRDMFELEVCEKECLARRCFEEGRPTRVDEILGHSKHSDQEETNLIVSAIPIDNDNGEVVAVLEIYRDVTAEARIQTRYKVLLDRERRRAEILEEQVKERTADLEASLEELRETKAQLVQSEKLSSLGQLVAGLAHEINNPINFIYGNLDFLQSYVDSFRQIIDKYQEKKLANEQDATDVTKLLEDLDYQYIVEDTRKLLTSIRNGAERATAIIRDLRAFIHQGTDQKTPVNLSKCIDTTASLLRHEMRGRIELERAYADGLPTVYGNEGQLNQVFMNLLANAIQAIEGEGTISIAIAERDRGVAIDIRDTGEGISEKNLLKVFDPFFTTKPVGKGTGLGLSISYSIVDGHGGRLTAQSDPDKEPGTTFTVWLPAKNEGSAATENPDPEASP